MCSDSTVLTVELCLSLLHDMILGTSVFTAVRWWWWWSRDLFSLVSVCLQRVQSVWGWWEVVLLCEDWLLTDDLSYTTVVTALMVGAVTLEQYFHFFLWVFTSPLVFFLNSAVYSLKAKCLKFKCLVSTLMLFTSVISFHFRAVYNLSAYMDFASQRVYLSATVITSKAVLVSCNLSPWTTICIYLTLLFILLPFSKAYNTF